MIVMESNGDSDDNDITSLTSYNRTCFSDRILFVHRQGRAVNGIRRLFVLRTVDEVQHWDQVSSARPPDGTTVQNSCSPVVVREGEEARG